MTTKYAIVGRLYVYRPSLLDIFDSKCDAKPGDIVRVVNLAGCPRANSMGHCYVEDESGKFLGLVMTNSLGEE